MEYCGEVCTIADFERRKEEYSRDKRRHYYFMSLKTDEVCESNVWWGYPSCYSGFFFFGFSTLTFTFIRSFLIHSLIHTFTLFTFVCSCISIPHLFFIILIHSYIHSFVLSFSILSSTSNTQSQRRA